MPQKKANNKPAGTSEVLELLLMDLYEQIKIVSSDEKEAPYIKLIELFFKGVDLKEKLNSYNSGEFSPPQVNIVSGVDENRI